MSFAILGILVLLAVVLGVVALVRRSSGATSSKPGDGADILVYLILALAMGVAGFALADLASIAFPGDRFVFDPAEVSDTNSYEEPKSYARGVPYVLVNGTLVIDGGEHTGARPGRPVLGSGYRPATATTN